MTGVLKVHTDASVIGERLPKGYMNKRRRVGATFVAWAGWHRCQLPARPTFAGQAYCGEHGTQRAEFYAVHHGLSAALSYVRSLPSEDRPGLVLMHVDNTTVYRLMVGESQASALSRHYETACDLCSQLVEAGVDVEWHSVSEKHSTHRVVDSMSKQAQQQVLIRKEWRPSDQAPAQKPPPQAEPADDDIPF